MRRPALRGAFVIGAAVAALAAGCAAPDVPAAGRPVPDYAAKSLDGRTMRLRDLRGDVVLLNIWATWCLPCRREMPGLEELRSVAASRRAVCPRRS